MKLCAVQTINNRTEETIRAVHQSFQLPGNQPDEMVIVLDRAPRETKHLCKQIYHNMGYPVTFCFIGGERGWKGPAKAWNKGFFTSPHSDAYYCISSEVVQDEGNIERAKQRMAQYPNTAIFGACHNSVAKECVIGADPGLLVSTKMPRPLGFIAALPAQAVRGIGGFDETYMQGFWYDDDDFFLRLWNHGVDFLFDDTIHGIHLDHDRPDLETTEGQAKIQLNHDTFLQKHGHQLHLNQPWFKTLPRIETRTENTLLWEHE